MKFRTFAMFVGPSVVMMLMFIAFPLVTVLLNSFQVTQPVFQVVETETCTPGFITQTCTTEIKTIPVLDGDGKTVTTTRWVGFSSYANVLGGERLTRALSDFDLGAVLQIDFWKALRFTLTFTLVTLPLVLGLGLAIAVVVNNAATAVKGPVIFVSLLPFIITPVIGALSIRWLFYGDGIVTVWLEALFDTNLSVAANGWAIEFLMMFYRVWHVAPFAFVIFYAGLQTVNQDTLESAIIDGASRWERLRYVVIPHLMPLIVFITLIHLMDAYRAFEEVIGFSSESYRITLQYLTYDYLTPDDAGNRQISSASASAMLTMIGVVVLLAAPLRRTWRDHRGA
ncbi:carbohydrate ABC transporter permease [Jannaschia helgolandensis]|uniref:Carbohydrate ABC transporter membrane protein 1, CUT1 family n=1 Tax=Jannaschia helgolandensis TaxID=188906 RepID=A0A1H7L7K6_9RHOB|nr:sugar ABC transporter permease [Jannaschia helgolandensis]SEK94928.1 carbohydrate ABC transporter membrane protein 1, CUT1 family [Jannaschia helgolandensis]|tara:strand:+ start:1858 stop:2877 length:1020 start_codon:yes stop_codon:yes gene_type:complete